MNLNLFNMIQSIAAVIFTDAQIVQSLDIWSIFKLALQFFWLNPSPWFVVCQNIPGSSWTFPVSMWNQSILHGACLC